MASTTMGTRAGWQGAGRGQSCQNSGGRWPVGTVPPIARGLLRAGHGGHADFIAAAAVPPAVVNTTLLGLHAVDLGGATTFRAEMRQRESDQMHRSCSEGRVCLEGGVGI